MTMPKQYQRLVGSKWTSKTSLRGWRHFEVVELRAVEGGYDALLVATCDAENVRPRVQAKQLFDRGVVDAGLDTTGLPCSRRGGGNPGRLRWLTARGVLLVKWAESAGWTPLVHVCREDAPC
ncbi:MAG: TIGR02450 family Trp-rich protein [Flavobacteriales bacterium]|nr:TIGR02450 family Trp-rich protein [Flavobacteriales bacterium]